MFSLYHKFKKVIYVVYCYFGGFWCKNGRCTERLPMMAPQNDRVIANLRATTPYIPTPEPR